MMEFNSEFISILEMIENNPVYMVLWAAFGLFFSSLVLFVPIKILSKIIKTTKVERGIGVSVTILMLCWLIGFVTQMGLFFSGIPGIKLFFIWVVMFLTYTVFSFYNRKMILKWISVTTKSSV